MEEIREVVFVNGIDVNLVGLKINNFELKKTENFNLKKNDLCITPKETHKIGDRFLGDTFGRGYEYSNIDEDGMKYYLYFEKVFNEKEHKSGEFHYETMHLINVLRLFKSSSVGFFCPLSVNSSGGCGAFADDRHSFHTVIDGDGPLLLTENEKTLINDFYSKTYKKKHNKIVSKMIPLFHDSYRIFSTELKFTLRVTILEILLEGNNELKFRLSRTVAVLLGKDKEESEEIFEKFKKIYDARSDFLHNGEVKKIDANVFIDALNISRRIIANLMYIEDDLKTIFAKVNSSGFGSNPYKVEM